MMQRDWCSQHGAALRIAVQVMPNAGKSEVLEEIEGALKIRLKALPIEGRADLLPNLVRSQPRVCG